jgi:hypothetical protein
MIPTICRLGSCVMMVVATPVQAQGIIKLAPASGSLEHEFNRVTSVRELRDGRVLVSDSRNQQVLAGDFDKQQVEVVGRNGPGPQEYQGASLLFATGGDSTLMLDLTRRWIVFRGAQVLGAVPPDVLVTKGLSGFIQGADSLGHVVVIRSRPGASDSANIVLLDRNSGSATTVGAVRLVTSQTRTVAQNGGTMTYRVFKPFATGEAVRIFQDGWIAIARLDPYRIDWYSADGRMLPGKPLPYSRHTLTETDQNGFREERKQRPGQPPMFDFSDFPKELPPFEYWAPGDPALIDAPNGNVLVRRTVAESLPANEYDIVDRLGVLRGTLQLAKRQRVVGVGARGIYVISSGADDIERLSRHKWP